MKYTAFISCFPVDKSNTICSIIINEASGNRFEKNLALKYGINEAELSSMEYIFKVIVDNEELEIHTINTYILALIDKNKAGKWVKKNPKYKELTDNIRNQCTDNNTSLIYGYGDDMEKVKWMAKAIHRLKDHPMKDKIKMP